MSNIKTKEAKKLIVLAKKEALQVIKVAHSKAEDLLKEPPNKGRYIDMARVPLICQSILNIDKLLDEIKNNMISPDKFNGLEEKVEGLSDNQKWIVRIVIGVVLVAVLGLIFANK